jgi:hypothetical protein
MTLRVSRSGSALVTCILLLVVVSVLAVGLASVSGVNLQVADNQHQANGAFASAESGLEVTRYWLSRARIPSTTAPADYVTAIIGAVATDLQAHAITNFAVASSGTIAPVTLDTLPARNFEGQWTANPTDPAILRAAVSGTNGPMSRAITVDYRIKPYHFPIFNYGIATRGPLQFPGNPTLNAAAQSWEADIYIESLDSTVALDIGGNGTFAGNITIGNDQAGVTYDGDLKIGGDTGQTAIDNHVETISDAEDRPEFPIPSIKNDFWQYVTGPEINSGTDLSGASTTWANATIAPNTNPRFAGSTTFQGILYIQSPNKVTFAGNVTLLGMIVADGAMGSDGKDVSNPYGNYISFGDPNSTKPSNFASGPYPAGIQFDALRQEQGSCILAPGFKVMFLKNFSAINGVIAASGLYFAWNASATVNGTLINYSNDPTVVEGNINFTFDRSSMVEIPAGFDLYRVPIYDPSSYSLAF